MKKKLLLIMPLVLLGCSNEIVIEKETLNEKEMYEILSSFQKSYENEKNVEGINFLKFSTCKLNGKECESAFLNFKSNKELIKILDNNSSEKINFIENESSSIEVKNNSNDNLEIVYKLNKFVELKNRENKLAKNENSSYHFELDKREKEYYFKDGERGFLLFWN